MDAKVDAIQEPCDYNHLILYAKGWYKRTDLLEDLKRIVAERCALDFKHVSTNDVWQVVSGAFLEHARKHDIESFLGKLFEKGIYDDKLGEPLQFGSDDNCPIRRALGLALSVLNRLRVLDEEGNAILVLGEPDPKVLPLKEKTKGAGV